MTNIESHVKARHPNWLPLPAKEQGGVINRQDVDENDAFSKANICSFFPRQGVGAIVSDRGETIPFSLSEIELVGPKGNARYIIQGGRVGFDVSRTSHGKRVSRMKVY